MKFLLLVFSTALSTLIFAQNKQTTSDTIITESNGWGQTTDEATNNAIRNGVENSMGLYISSSTLIENYTLVRDVIHSSSDGYCFKYDLLGSSFDKGSGLYHINLKVYIANKRLVSDVNSKISANNIIDMTSIEKLKFELSQKRQRAKSSLLYLSNYLQQNYQKPFFANFDSIHISNGNQSNNNADIELCYSFSWNQEALDAVSKQQNLLSKRANQYTDRNFYIIYNIKFAIYISDVNYGNMLYSQCGNSWNINNLTFSRGFSFNTVSMDKKCKPFDLKYNDVGDQFYVNKKDFCKYIVGSAYRNDPNFDLNDNDKENMFNKLYVNLYKSLQPCNSFIHFLMPCCDCTPTIDKIIYTGQNKYSDKIWLRDINLNIIKNEMLSVKYSLFLIEDPKNSSLRFRYYPTGQSVYRNDSETPDRLYSNVYGLVIENKIANIDSIFSSW